MVSLNINIQKKDLWLISAVMVFLVGVGVVIGFGDYNSGNPQVMGHSSDEIMVNVSGSLVSLQSAIDARSFGGMEFGNWIDKSSDYGTQQANSDGFVIASGDDSTIIGYTSDSSTPTEKIRSQSYPSGGYWSSITMPVREDDYWKIPF